MKAKFGIYKIAQPKTGLFLILVMSFFAFTNISQAQEKREETKLEKINKKKNKANRRLERRGDKAKSNKKQKRVLKYKTQSSQGEQAHRGDITGRRIQTSQNRTRRSTANYAKPTPYAGRKRTSEASRAKEASRRFYPPVSATRRGERAFDKSISGRKLKPNKPSARRQVYDRVSPYRYKKRQTENDKAKRAAKRNVGFRSATGQAKTAPTPRANPYAGKRRLSENDKAKRAAKARVTPITGTRRGERAPVPSINPYMGKKRPTENDKAKRAAKNRVSPISATRRGERPPVTQTSPYQGKKRLTENDKAKRAAKNTKSPISATRRGERGRSKMVNGQKPGPRTITGTVQQKTPRVNPYQGQKRMSEGEKARKSSRRFSPPSSVSRSGEKSSKRVSIQPRSATGRNRASQPAVSPYLGQPRKTENDKAKRAAKNRESPISATRNAERTKKKPAPTPRSVTGFRKTPAKATDPYLGKERRTPEQRANANARRFSAPRSISIGGAKPGKKTRIEPRTASHAFMRRRKNPYSGRKMQQWEEAHKGDITGRKVRTKTSTLPQPRKPSFNPYEGRAKAGDKPYSGKFSINNRSVTRPSEAKADRNRIFDPYSGRGKRGDKAYSGNIQGQAGRTATKSAESKPGKALQGGRTMSITGQVTGKPKRIWDPYYGRGKRGDKPYSGNIQGQAGRTATKSAESKPGKAFQNRTMSISGQVMGKPKRIWDPYYGRGKRGDKPYNGNIQSQSNRTATRSAEQGGKRPAFAGGKSLSITGKFKGPGKPLPTEGGGSVTKQWNNNGKPLSRRDFSKDALNVARFQGNLKAQKPLKGGGSITTLWNNDGKPIARPDRPSESLSMSQFQGNMKASKPIKGAGGSITTLWNNEGKPIDKIPITPNIYKAARYSGNMKANKPLKGAGGTVTTLWNNDGKPLEKLAISPQIHAAARFKGTTKRSQLPELNDAYSGYSGNIKVTKARGKDFHPSFYLSNNKSGPRDMDKKIELRKIWVSIFKTNQPSHLRRKQEKLRFDPAEQGMWFD